jgi:histidinol dehydrogenase
MCTPPQKDGSVHPAMLYAARISGVTQICRVGGAQAIAALAFGTGTIPKVHKIFGPGNHFVTEAKLAAQRYGIAIDMPAGPSEVLVLADATARPDFIAADMISQAEHGADSQVVLVTTHRALIEKTRNALEEQLADLPRKAIAETALGASMMVYFDDLESAIAFSNHYAPEHLILSLDNPHSMLDLIRNAGSVFVGHYSPESVGDYASGTNHTLPTNGWARAYSGVSLDSFTKRITFQELTREGIRQIGPAVETMARAELLEGHQRAVTIRLKNL